jgi:hypothetical protein
VSIIRVDIQKKRLCHGHGQRPLHLIDGHRRAGKEVKEFDRAREEEWGSDEDVREVQDDSKEIREGGEAGVDPSFYLINRFQ